jgi:PPOX class probable F420-dependent enzyme
MGIPLSDATLRLLDGKNYAVLATVNPGGSPQTSVVWVGRDGADLLFSTVEGRVKHRNMLRDSRVSVTVIDSADPENYVELRGRVSMTPDIGRRLDTGCHGSMTARTLARTVPERSAWSCGWWWRKPPGTPHNLEGGPRAGNHADG